MSTAGTEIGITLGARTGRTGASRAGGSLVEVTIALVLLAVGILALQAMALAAGLSVSLAERNTKRAFAATRSAELAVAKLSVDSLPLPMDCTLGDGGHLSRNVLVSPSGTVARFEVVVSHPARASTRRAITVSGYAYSPRGFSQVGEEDDCP